MTTGNSHPATTSISRNELIWLASAVIFGLILRIAYPGRMAIEHFDEGVYASNFWFDAEQGYAYPFRHLYAPPLLPAAIEWTMMIANLFGIKPTGFIPMIPCLVAGIAMIPSMWWIGRQWFGSTAGLISAWMVATSDFHACYSRAAMTDVPVCLLILWAVYFIWRSFVGLAATSASDEQRKKLNSVTRLPPFPWQDIVLAGGATGLAWWTKYNGWLPLAIGFAGGFLWQLLTPRPERQIRRTLACWSWIAVIACLVWSPVLWGLQSQGGYSSVAANHRQYLVGFKGWGESALKQAEQIGFYDNWFGMFIEPFGVHESNETRYSSLWELTLRMLGPWTIREAFTRSNPLSLKLRILQNRCAMGVIPLILLIVAAIALRKSLRFSVVKSERISSSLLAAWFCGMTIATPFYHPYPRLLFPWLIAAWLAFGLAIQLWRNRSSNMGTMVSLALKRWIPSRIEWVLVVWLTANSLVRSYVGTAHAWEDRTSLEVAAKSIATRIGRHVDSQGPVGDKAIACVWGEPALFFGLRSDGLSYVVPVPNLQFIDHHPERPTFLVFGNQSFDSLPLSTENRRLERCQLLELLPIRPSHLVVMDSMRRDFAESKDASAPKVWFYHVPD